MSWGIKAPLGNASPHFTYRELACKHCGHILSVEVADKLAAFLEEIRIHFAALKPHEVIRIHIDSAHRCPIHNKEVGGKGHSYHMRGLAADIVVSSFTVPEVYHECKIMKDRGQIGGLGKYAHFTHIDKGPKRGWKG